MYVVGAKKMVAMKIQVQCLIGKGLSEKEYIILIKDKDGMPHETWADHERVTVIGSEREKIARHEAHGSVSVRVVEHREPNVLIELPNETMSSGRRVWISSGAIAP